MAHPVFYHRGHGGASIPCPQAKILAALAMPGRAFDTFLDIYPKAYEHDYGFLRPVIPEVVEKFMGCGDFTKGFARVRCAHCAHEPNWAGAR